TIIVFLVVWPVLIATLVPGILNTLGICARSICISCAVAMVGQQNQRRFCSYAGSQNFPKLFRSNLYHLSADAMKAATRLFAPDRPRRQVEKLPGPNRCLSPPNTFAGD